MSQPDLSSHHLPPSTSTHIFKTQILPQDISPIPPSPSPTTPYALLTLGQTGAGKTLLVPPLLTSLRRHGRNPAHLIADVYKTFHPSYSTLPTGLASRACSKDARLWLEMAVREGCERRIDMLVESACRHPDDFIGLVRILAEAGYKVVIVVLAVPYALSRLGVLVRYFGRLPESGSRGLGVRLTPTKVHDDSYEGLLRAAEWLDENRHMIDRCVVLRRGNLVSFVAEKEGQADIEESVAAALKRERKRSLTEKERGVAREGVERLRGLPEAESVLEEVELLLEPLLTQETVQGEYPELWPLKIECDDLKAEDDILGMKITTATI